MNSQTFRPKVDLSQTQDHALDTRSLHIILIYLENDYPQFEAWFTVSIHDFPIHKQFKFVDCSNCLWIEKIVLNNEAMSTAWNDILDKVIENPIRIRSSNFTLWFFVWVAIEQQV